MECRSCSNSCRVSSDELKDSRTLKGLFLGKTLNELLKFVHVPGLERTQEVSTWEMKERSQNRSLTWM